APNSAFPRRASSARPLSGLADPHRPVGRLFRQFQPCPYDMLETAGQKLQEIRALSLAEMFRISRSQSKQGWRGGAADIEAQEGIRRNNACRRAEEDRLARSLGSQGNGARWSHQLVDGAGRKAANTVQTHLREALVALLDAEINGIKVEQHRKIGTDRFHEVLEGASREQCQQRLVNPALDHDVGTAVADQFVAEPAQPLRFRAPAKDHRLLQIYDTAARSG